MRERRKGLNNSIKTRWNETNENKNIREEKMRWKWSAKESKEKKKENKLLTVYNTTNLDHGKP